MPPNLPNREGKVIDELRNQLNRPTFLRNIFVIRLINAWWLATFFQPDEYFQSLEPAWNLAFGPNSGAWLTWEWQHQLRSSIHPLIFSGVYIVANFISNLVLPAGNALRAPILIAAPRILQAGFAALGDWYTWQLAVKIYGANSNISFFALFLQLFSPWQWYTSTRTFSNSLETTMTIMALYYFPWSLLSAGKQNTKENPKPAPLNLPLWSLRASLCLAALATILRPTNVLIWAAIIGVVFTGVTLRGSSPLTLSTVLTLLREGILCGSLVLGASLLSDRMYFGFWTFPPYEWLNFNISQSLAVFYGRNPWHYYFLQGLPLLCTASLPFALAGLYRPAAETDNQFNTLRALSHAVFFTIGALSLISHKEVRFIYPLLPILHILAAPTAASFFTSQPAPTTQQPRPRPRLQHKYYLYAALGTNIFLAGYLSFLHQPAPLNVLSYLRREYERIHPSAVRHFLNPPPPPMITSHNKSEEDDVDPERQEHLFALFLMPCHSTPWRSHLVYPSLTARALTCEPPLHTKPNTPERINYRDEADRFYDAPLDFLQKEAFPSSNNGSGSSSTSLVIPRYIVGFEGVEPWLQEFLATTNAGESTGMELRRVWAGFNGFFNEDSRRSGRMMVWDTGVYGNPPAKKE